MMKKKLTLKYLIAFILILFCTNAFAQQGFKYKASLTDIKEATFYKIVLTPDIIAKCKTGLVDLRLLDADNNQTAYIIKQDEAKFTESNFVEFPIINKTKEADKQTHITIENKSPKAISDLLLVTTNMDAKRVVNISGSNDLKQWYVIKEGVYLDNYFGSKEEELVQTISLPLVNYKYFQVTIIGKDILPFNIKNAGIYTEDYIEGKYIKIPSPLITQKDSSNKKSYVHLKFKEAYPIDKLTIEAIGPKFFKRDMAIYIANNESTRNPFATSISSTFSDLFLNGLAAKDYLIEVYNNDNAPLKIKSVQAFQLNQYLLAYLEAGKKYQLYFGDSLLNAPVYDLAFFKDSIGKNPPEIATGSIEKLVVPVTAAIPSKSNNKVLLWCIIGVAAILLLTLTFKMVKELNKRNNDVHL